jgi:hypothetical protein
MGVLLPTGRLCGSQPFPRPFVIQIECRVEFAHRDTFLFRRVAIDYCAGLLTRIERGRAKQLAGVALDLNLPKKIFPLERVKPVRGSNGGPFLCFSGNGKEALTSV